MRSREEQARQRASAEAALARTRDAEGDARFLLASQRRALAKREAQLAAVQGRLRAVLARAGAGGGIAGAELAALLAAPDASGDSGRDSDAENEPVGAGAGRAGGKGYRGRRPAHLGPVGGGGTSDDDAGNAGDEGGDKSFGEGARVPLRRGAASDAELAEHVQHLQAQLIAQRYVFAVCFDARTTHAAHGVCSIQSKPPFPAVPVLRSVH